MSSEITVKLTREQVDIIRSITIPRVSMPDAKVYGDWSIDLDRRLREALVEAGETTNE